MAGRGHAPKLPDEPRHPRSHDPQRPFRSATSKGWQHGPTPKPPTGMTTAARQAWKVWFGAWFAAFWTPEDVPALRHLVALYDQVERGEFQRHGELRIAMDTYGITPKGQQDRRWLPPKTDDKPAVDTATGQKYGHLRSVVGA